MGLSIAYGGPNESRLEDQKEEEQGRDYTRTCMPSMNSRIERTLSNRGTILCQVGGTYIVFPLTSWIALCQRILVRVLNALYIKLINVWIGHFPIIP